MPLTKNRMVRRLTGCLSSDAARALGFLTRGLDADGKALDHGPGIDRHRVAADLDGELVETPGGGATFLLPDPVVFRAVARAFEPLRRLAPGHTTAEVDTLLEDGDEAGLQPRQDRLRVRVFGPAQRRFRIGIDVRPGLGDVERLLLLGDLGQDVLPVAGPDLAAEAAGQARPQEGDHGHAEAAPGQALGADDAAVEELPPVHSEGLGVGGGLPEADQAAGGRQHRLARYGGFQALAGVARSGAGRLARAGGRVG